MALAYCVLLNATANITIVNDTVPDCLREVRGCALLNESRVVVATDNNTARMNATIFHELLHLELGPEHTETLIARDNAYRDYLGVYDRYLWSPPAGGG